MLNAQKHTSIEDLRYQLGALFARSEAELNIFYQLFDAYVEKHTYQAPPEELPPPPIGSDKKRLQRLLAFIPLIATIIGTAVWWAFFRPQVAAFRCPTDNKYTISANISGSGRYNQEFNFQFQGIRSEIEGFEEQLENQNVRLEWDLGDGTILTDSSKTYRYADAGRFEPELRLIINDSCVCQRRDTLIFKLDDRLRPNFSFQQIAVDSFQFRESSYYFSSPDSLRPSDTTNVGFTWNFGDGQTSTERNPSHKYEDVKEYEVTLEINAEWPDTAVKAVHTRQVSNLPKPKLGFLPLEDENISDLLPSSDPNFIPFILALAALVSYLIYEIIRAWQRKIALEEAPLRGPPIRQPLELDPPTLNFLQSQDFYELSRRLRRRREGQGGLRPDIPRSIEETAQAGGFPTLEWHKRTQASQYLILMKADSKYDHLVQLFAAMTKEWEARDISVAFYTYERNPRLCKRVNGKQRISLSQLHNLYPNDRLIVIGEGEELLSEEGDALADWTEDFDSWTQRAWLSSKSTEDWGQSEEILSRTFLLLPATQTGMNSLVEKWEAEQQHELRWWKRNHFEISLPNPESPNIISELKIYLGEAGFQWLAACAWYPELRWELSLQLGKLIETYHPDAPLDELDSLLHLLRLSYFREGGMSRKLREKLVAELPEKQSKVVREHLLDLLQQERNQPPPDSYAAVDQQVRIALFQYLNSSKDGKAKKALKDAIKDLEPEDIEDQLSLKELSKVNNNPLALILPARYFRGQVPFFGLRQKVRILLMGIPLLIMAGLGYYMSFEANKGEDYNAKRIYVAEELQLQNATDSTRWNIHNGYLQTQLDSALIASGGISREALGYFQQAIRLEELQILQETPLSQQLDSLRLKALNNFSLSYYNYAVYAYNREDFQTAIDSLFQPSGFLMSLLDPERRTTQAQLWIPYAIGMSHLRMQQREDGIRTLQTVFCDTIPDTVYQQYVRDSLLKQEEVQRMFEFLDKNSSSQFTATFLRCMWDERESTIELPIENEDSTLIKLQTYTECVDSLEGSFIIKGIVQGNISESLVIVFRDKFNEDEYEQEIVIGEEFYSRPFPSTAAVDVLLYQKLISNNGDITYREEVYHFRSKMCGEESTCTIQALRFSRNAEAICNNDGTFSIEFIANAFAIDTLILYDNLGSEPVKIANNGIGDFKTKYGVYSSGTAVTLTIQEYGKEDKCSVSLPVDAVDCGNNNSNDLTQEETNLSVPKPRMVFITGGTFQMGNLFEEEDEEDETPHEVTVDDFQMSAYEVSFAAFDRFCDATGYTKPDDSWGRGLQPVMNVDWYDAVLYCNWLSVQHGYDQVYTIDSTRQDPNNQNEKGSDFGQDSKKWWVTVNWNANGYRLPTEVEWEYAAREQGRDVRFGNGRDTADATQMNFDASEDYKKPYSKVGQYREQTVEVNSFAPNSLRLYNMSGNVLEWCWDWYGGNYYSESQGTRNPRGPSSGLSRVLRGGSWDAYPIYCRAANRSYNIPADRYLNIGFRLVRLP